MIGTHYESQRLIEAYEEQDFQTYLCPFCGAEKQVAVTFDLVQRAFFPERFADTICDKDDEAMDRVKGE